MDVADTYRNFIDVVVHDALACNSRWIDLCINLGIDVVVRIKKNKNNFLKEVKNNNKKDPVEIWNSEKEFDKVEIYDTTFTMDNVD